MPQIKISWADRFFRLFKPVLKPYLVDGKYKVIPAFSIGGTDYWMYDSAMEIPAGRYLAAMGMYVEVETNINKDYLTEHCKAMDKILSNGKSISLQSIMLLNIHMKERMELLPTEEAIYRYASVIFFDNSESLYSYDYVYNVEKIKKWKAAGGTLDFFSKTPLKELIPSLSMSEKDTLIYSTARDMILKTHQALLDTTLYEEP